MTVRNAAVFFTALVLANTAFAQGAVGQGGSDNDAMGADTMARDPTATMHGRKDPMKKKDRMKNHQLATDPIAKRPMKKGPPVTEALRDGRGGKDTVPADPVIKDGMKK